MERFLVETKRESVELQYRRESARLASTYKAEVVSREQLKRAESLVWSEIARQAGGVGTVGGLERSLRAHRTLAEAQRLHSQALGARQQQSLATQQARAVRDQLVAMLASVRRKETNAFESRQCEDSMELVAAKAVMRDRIEPFEGSEDCDTGYVSERDPLKHVVESVVPALGSGLNSNCPCDAPPSAVAGVIATPTIQASLSENGEGTTTLSMLCPGSAGGTPVGLTIQRRSSEGLSIVIHAALPGLVAALLRDRAALLRELTQSGFCIQRLSVEVGGAASMNEATSWSVARRRSRKRGDNEALVA